jgi:hypothetical protein
VHERFVQFVFEGLVFPFQFNEMRLYCHAKPPRLDQTSDSSGSTSVHQRPILSMDIRNGIFNILAAICNES